MEFLLCFSPPSPQSKLSLNGALWCPVTGSTLLWIGQETFFKIERIFVSIIWGGQKQERLLLISMFLSKNISRKHSLPEHIKYCLLCRVLESYGKWIFMILMCLTLLWKFFCGIYKDSFVMGDIEISLDEISKLMDCFVCLSL